MDMLRSGFAARQLRARPLAAFALFFSLGLIIGLRFLPAAIPCVICAAIVFAGCIILALSGCKCASALMLLFAFLSGMAYMSCHINSFPAIKTQYSVSITGRILSEPYTNPNTGRVISRFQIESIDGADSDYTVRLYLRGDAESLKSIEFGQRLSATAHIWESEPVSNPHEFDFSLYLRMNGMDAFATAKIEDVQILEKGKGIKADFIRMRKNIGARIDNLFPENSGLVRALILGDRSQMSEEMRESFSKTGIAHLVAISGLHVTTLAWMTTALFGLFLPKNKSITITMVLLIFYGCLIGFSASFLRALIMFLVFSFARAAGYPSDNVTRLCVAMMVILLIKPLSFMDAGFVLSFSSTAGILLLAPPIYRLLRVDGLLHLKPFPNPFLQGLRNAILYFPKLLCISISAQLATLPAVIAYFGVQSIISIPFNLICVPICMLGYPIALAALLISALCMPIACIAGSCAEALFSSVIAAAKWGASLPYTDLRIGYYAWWLVLLHAAIMAAASNLSRIREGIRNILPLVLIAVAALSSLITYSNSLDFSITFLDADQADCAIVRTQGNTYLVDTGDTYTPAADYLSATCLHLDGIFLSHPHQDHAGGLEDILTIMKPDAIYVPAGWFDHQDDISQAIMDGMSLAESMHIKIIELAAGDEFPLSRDTKLSVHSPDRTNLPKGINDISLLMSISHSGKSVLFTGDLSREGEPEFIPDIDILKVAHHGSNKASSPAFLKKASPEIAVISVGENSFDHPADETIEHLNMIGAEILRTDRLGAVTLHLKRDGSWHTESYFPMEEYNDLE